ETHFFDLAVLEHQNSVEEFLRAYPHLARPEQLDAQTLAFVLGYINPKAHELVWCRRQLLARGLAQCTLWA
ncbi:MAG TPA: hypothetical protein VJ728_08930, partial [Candidatus Binataceae bacterium]|nr:hypothetical protein [Candidatus Binataceae bacterium]